MRKLLIALASAGMLVAAFAMPVGAATGDPSTVMVMKHLCNPDIQSVADFNAVEAKGVDGVSGTDNPVAGLVATVLACPTIVRSGDSYTDGAVASKIKADFNFSLTDANGTQKLADDATFQQAALCEDVVKLDANGDGKISADTCLDISNYMFANVAEGMVTVEETVPPDGSRFGVIRFTPGSTDEKALLGELSANPIKLDTTKDTAAGDAFPTYADDVIMLHVYDFQAPASSGQMPDTSVNTPAPSNDLPLAVFGFIALFAAGGLLLFRFVMKR